MWKPLSESFWNLGFWYLNRCWRFYPVWDWHWWICGYFSCDWIDWHISRNWAIWNSSRWLTVQRKINYERICGAHCLYSSLSIVRRLWWSHVFYGRLWNFYSSNSNRNPQNIRCLIFRSKFWHRLQFWRFSYIIYRLWYSRYRLWSKN